MKDVYQIIKKPIVNSEKAELLRRNQNVYTFEVNVKSNKVEIRKAIETIFNVEVENVNTNTLKPTIKRFKNRPYKTQMKKKAFVKLKEGHSIAYYEGV